MALKEDLKAAIVQSGFTMTQVIEQLNAKYDRDISIQNFSSKLRRESLKYTEVQEILDVIGYDIVWKKK